jgi:hypothetical protein
MLLFVILTFFLPPVILSGALAESKDPIGLLTPFVGSFGFAQDDKEMWATFFVILRLAEESQRPSLSFKILRFRLRSG